MWTIWFQGKGAHLAIPQDVINITTCHSAQRDTEEDAGSQKCRKKYICLGTSCKMSDYFISRFMVIGGRDEVYLATEKCRKS